MSPTEIVESDIQKNERWIKACQWLTTDGRRRDYPMTEGFMLLSLWKILGVNGRTDANAAVWFQNRSKFKTSSEFHIAFLKKELIESNGDKKRQILKMIKLYQDPTPPQPSKKNCSVLHISKTFVREVKFEEPLKTTAALNVLAEPFSPKEALNVLAEPFSPKEALNVLAEPPKTTTVLNAEAKPFDEVTGPVYSAVAAQLMAKMGYREGWGLGKTENGIREPHTMTIRPPGMTGVGYKGRR